MKIVIYIICFLLFSCNNQNRSGINIKETETVSFKDTFSGNKQEKNDFIAIDFPPDLINLSEVKLPTYWKNTPFDDNALDFTLEKAMREGKYDAIDFFIRKKIFSFYERLMIHQKKLPFIPMIKNEINEDTYYKIDSAYYAGTFNRKDSIFSIDIYKNGHRYTTGGETSAPVNYLVFVTKDRATNKMIDHKVVYSEIQVLYEPKYCYFYIDNSLMINLYHIDIDEIKSHFLKRERYKINKQGYFVQK